MTGFWRTGRRMILSEWMLWEFFSSSLWLFFIRLYDVTLVTSWVEIKPSGVFSEQSNSLHHHLTKSIMRCWPSLCDGDCTVLFTWSLFFRPHWGILGRWWWAAVNIKINKMYTTNQLFSCYTVHETLQAVTHDSYCHKTSHNTTHSVTHSSFRQCETEELWDSLLSLENFTNNTCRSVSQCFTLWTNINWNSHEFIYQTLTLFNLLVVHKTCYRIDII